MKVLQINCVYKTGSTGKIVYDLHSGLLEQGIESIVCYGRGVQHHEENVYKTCPELYSKMNHLYARMRGQLYGGCRFSTNKLFSIIREQKPDIVHLQCINGYFVNIFKLVEWLKKEQIKTVLTLHAEFMFTANCGHARECERWKNKCGNCPQLKTDLHSFGIDGTRNSWKKMCKAFERFEDNLIVVSVSPWLMERAKQSPILGQKQHCVVMNGLDTGVFYRRDITTLKEKYPSETKLIFFATTLFTDREDDLKGGRYVLKLARQMEHENVKFIVAGRYDETIAYPSNMVMLGRLESQDMLAQYYSLADVTILTSARETFSMVTAESLCCGTPVVGFEAGGPESIALSQFSSFVKQGDVAALNSAIHEMLARSINRQELEEQAHDAYSSERMVQGYIDIYQDLFEKQL